MKKYSKINGRNIWRVKKKLIPLYPLTKKTVSKEEFFERFT